MWRDIRRYNVTLGGQVFLSMVFLSGVTGGVTLVIPVYHLFCTLMGVYLAVYIVAQSSRRRLGIHGRMPDQAVAGESVHVEFKLTNLSRLAAHDVSLRFFHLPKEIRQEGSKTIACLGGGRSQILPLTLVPLRRGLYDLPAVRAFTTFPFNLLRTGGARLDAGSLLVLPSFHPLEGVDLEISRRYQPGGIALTSNVGESPEYSGNRDYRPGDAMRKIDFRSWARLARPVVKEYQEEYYCRVALVLDTFIGRRGPGPRSGHADLEAAVSLCAAIAHALSRGECVIDIFTAGPELYMLRTGRHTSHMDSILEILAGVNGCRQDPFETVTPALAEQLAGISAVVCVLLDWGVSQESLVRTASEFGCNTKVVIVRKGKTSRPIRPEEVSAETISVYRPDQVQRGELERV